MRRIRTFLMLPNVGHSIKCRQLETIVNLFVNHVSDRQIQSEGLRQKSLYLKRQRSTKNHQKWRGFIHLVVDQ